jgi:hypothetical protein
MPILIKHSGNVAPTAVGAYGGGQGRRQAEDTRQALSLAEQEAAQKRGIAAQQTAAAKGQTFQAEQADLSRKFSAEQAGLSREAASAQAQAGRDFQQDMAFDSSERAAAAAEESYNRETQAKQAEYTQKQMDEFNRLQDVRDSISRNTGLNDAEKQDMLLQVDAQQAGIKPLQRMKKPSEWPEGQGIGQTWKSEDGGAVYTRNADGEVKSIHKPPTNKLTMQDTVKLTEAVTKMLTVMKPDGKGGETAVPPDADAIQAGIERIVKLTRQLNGEPDPEQQPVVWDSAYNRQAVDAKFPPPEKPVITAEDTAQQARSKERSYAAEMAKWRAANDARMRGEPVPEGGNPLVPETAAEVAGVDQQTSAAKPNVIKVSTKAEYEGLAPDTLYMKPDGLIRRKP